MFGRGIFYIRMLNHTQYFVNTAHAEHTCQVINATNSQHVAAGVNFARKYNVRLNVKGSGHGTYISAIAGEVPFLCLTALQRLSRQICRSKLALDMDQTYSWDQICRLFEASGLQ